MGAVSWYFSCGPIQILVLRSLNPLKRCSWKALPFLTTSTHKYFTSFYSSFLSFIFILSMKCHEYRWRSKVMNITTVTLWRIFNCTHLRYLQRCLHPASSAFETLRPFFNTRLGDLFLLLVDRSMTWGFCRHNQANLYCQFKQPFWCLLYFYIPRKYILDLKNC